MITNEELASYLNDLKYETIDFMGTAVEQTQMKQIYEDSIVIAWIISQMKEFSLDGYIYKRHTNFLQRIGPKVIKHEVLNEWQ